jgi:predicted nucleic acid-binding protein
MSLILDSSAILAWVYADETTEPIRHVLDLLIDGGAWVPALWKLEVANAFQFAVRHRRINANFRDSALADLAQLPIHVDEETSRQAWGATLRVAERHRLTVYDAAYLELAMRRGLPLATLDAELRAAARAGKVPLLGM